MENQTSYTPEQIADKLQAEISHRDISDFQENVALKPFMKELPSGEA